MKGWIKYFGLLAMSGAFIFPAKADIKNPLESEPNKDMKSGVIMKIDGEEVPTQEFLYLFNKNNNQQTTSQSIDEYMEMFENFRLKVAEAKSLGIDTTASFRKEINSYRRELLEPYVADSLLIKELVDEAYRRDSVMVESSHIMIVRTNNPQRDSLNVAMLDSIRTELINGADFIAAAKRHSQDRFSSDKGGYLGFTPAGYYPYAFETAVYQTPEGEISEIIESHVGWHIVKSGARKSSEELNRPTKSYNEIKNEVERKISTPFDSRFHLLRHSSLNNLKERYPDVDVKGLSDEQAYQALLLVEDSVQYANNEEFHNLVDEYINGSLLYVVSVENIWDKAANDEEGLQALYNADPNKYSWGTPHAKGILVVVPNDSVGQKIKEEVIDMQSSEILNHIKSNYKKGVKAERFNVAQGAHPLIDRLMFGVESQNGEDTDKNTYILLEEKVISSPEGMEDVKNDLISEYQDLLEQAWLSELRQKHFIEWNREELSKIKAQLDQPGN